MHVVFLCPAECIAGFGPIFAGGTTFTRCDPCPVDTYNPGPGVAVTSFGSSSASAVSKVSSPGFRTANSAVSPVRHWGESAVPLGHYYAAAGVMEDAVEVAAINPQSCRPCPTGSVTLNTGSTSAAQCGECVVTK